MTGIEKVLALENGSATAVARRLSEYRDCSRQQVEYWMKRGYVPGNWAPLVTREYGVSLHDLNPTVYPKGIPVARHDAVSA